MKSLAVLPLLIVTFLTSLASEYYEGTVVFLDGKSKRGLLNSSFGDYVEFKQTEKSEPERIDAAKLSKVIFKIRGENREYHYLKVYLGWGQKRISNQPMWLKVVQAGIATLYVNSTSVSTPSNSMNSAGFLDYYCIRAGEPAAKVIANVSTLNNNQTFRAKAPLYFADYPELAAKIKSKEYTWKDLEVVVSLYNKWASAKTSKKAK